MRQSTSRGFASSNISKWFAHPRKSLVLSLIAFVLAALGWWRISLQIAPLGDRAADIQLPAIIVWLAGLLPALVAAVITYLLASRQSSLSETVRSQSQELALSGEKLRLAVEASGVGLFDWDLPANQVRFSPEWKRQIGYEPYEIQDDFEEWRTRLHPDDLEPTLARLAESIKNPAAGYETEFRLRHKDGSYRWILARGSFQLNAGEPVRMLGCHVDLTGQKQSILALSASENRLRFALEGANDGLWDVDMRTDAVYLSPRDCEILGYRPEEMPDAAKAWYQFVHPDDLPETNLRLSQHLQGLSPVFEMEQRLRTKSGKWKWILTRGKLVERSPDGQPLRMTGTHTDITRRKQAEDKIFHLVERLDLAARSARLGVWDWDIVNDQLLWDDRMFELYGIRAADFAGAYAAWLQGVHPDDQAFCAEAINQALRGEKEVDIEFRVVWPGGSIRWIKADGHVVFAADGRPQRMIGVNYDITARKQAEAELRASEAALRERNFFIETIMENAPIGLAVNRISDGQTTFVNSQFSAIYGVPPDTMRNVDEYFENVYLDPVFREQMRARVLADMASGDPARMRWENIPITTRAGEDKVITAINIPLFDQDLMISTVQDVTKRWRAKEEIRELNARLEQRVTERTAQLESTNRELEAANQELEAFSYSVSHDLRAPLRGIDGWSLALFEDYYEMLDEKGRQYIERVRAETQRMGQLIDDLLRLSRISRADMQRGVVDLSELAQTIAGRLTDTQPDRLIEWTIEPGLFASGDAHLLEIVLTNLLSNAFKFTGRQPQASIAFGKTRAGGKEVYFIRDNGAGFNMAYAKNLFGAFQRMHRQSEFPGTGIGLATAQRIIRRHGGKIWAEAEKNAGATFYFTLEEAG